MSSNKLSRRKFLILGGLAAATATTAGRSSIGLSRTIGMTSDLAQNVDAALIPSSQAASPSVPIAVAHGRDYAAITTQAIAALHASVAARGERVVIKPALAWDRQPGSGVNVHPDVLRALITLALAAGASQVTLFDRTACAPVWAYRMNGAQDMVNDIGDSRVQLLALSETDFVPFEAGKSPELALAGTRVCRYVLEADRIINVATMHQHPTRGISLAMANLLGLIGGERANAEWLKRRDAELAALSAAFHPTLTLLDATSAVLRNGPLGNSWADVSQLHTVVASQDPVAVESVGARLFAQAAGTPMPDLPHIALAEQFGLGSAIRDLKERRVIDLHMGGKV